MKVTNAPVLIPVRLIPDGSILWYGFHVIGTKGYSLKKEYLNYKCYKIEGNPYDYEIIIPRVRNVKRRKTKAKEW